MINKLNLNIKKKNVSVESYKKWKLCPHPLHPRNIRNPSTYR